MSSLPLYRCQTESQPSYMSPGAEAQRGLMGQQSWTQCPEFPEGTVSGATRSGSMLQGPQLAAASEKFWFKGLFGERVPP